MNGRHVSMILGVVFFASHFPAMSAEKDSEYRNAIVNGADAMIILSLVDDAGEPVSNASVRCAMSMLRDGGGEFVGATDEMGGCVMSGRTNGNRIEIRASKRGYYDSLTQLCFTDMHNRRVVRNGKWQPYGENVNLTLKPIKNPVQMLRGALTHEIPATNVWFGFDFERNDWKKPHGKGERSDVEIRLQWDGKLPWEYPNVELEMRIKEEGSAYVAKLYSQSVMPFPYQADDSLFGSNQFRFYRFFDSRGGRWREHNLGQDEAMILRTRVRKDDGRIVACNYTRINQIIFNGGKHGRGTVMLFYDYNPNSMDANLECAMENNISPVSSGTPKGLNPTSQKFIK